MNSLAINPFAPVIKIFSNSYKPDSLFK
jgi:hypothetical protein